MWSIGKNTASLREGLKRICLSVLAIRLTGTDALGVFSAKDMGTAVEESGRRAWVAGDGAG
jgi:hypothetical protein